MHFQADTPVLLAATGFCIAVVLGAAFLLRRKRHAAHGHAGHAGAQMHAFRAARWDPLTGLQARPAFVAALTERLARGQDFALLRIDIDRFGALNAAIGHAAGDEVLLVVAKRVAALAADRARTGRLGDDEFGVIIDTGPNEPDADSAVLAARRALCAPIVAGGHEVEAEISIGLALAPAHGHDAATLLRAAQRALEHVKSAGGGSWTIFDPAQEEADRAQAQLRQELRDAVLLGEFVPYYQPIVELQTGEVVGLEVLARWNNPRRGMVDPDQFIPLAESMQLAGAISLCLLRRVVRDSRDWPAHFYFAFNASPNQLRQLVQLVHGKTDWPEGVLDPKRIEIEVTESALIQDLDVAREVIAGLQARGTRVVLDDFGAGFSNFFHLRELPFDRLKIDRGFVTDMTRHRRAEACVRSMIGLAKSLSIETVAEGIETAATADMLADLGCRYGQGYFFSRPVPSSEVPALLRRTAPRQRPLAIDTPRIAAAAA